MKYKLLRFSLLCILTMLCGGSMWAGSVTTWVKTDPVNPNISYMGLPSGTYTLCVRMFKDDGTMGEHESRLVIIIGTPWYLSWWAWIIYLLLAAGILYKIGHRSFYNK